VLIVEAVSRSGNKLSMWGIIGLAEVGHMAVFALERQINGCGIVK
jgi:hypothetical protein